VNDTLLVIPAHDEADHLPAVLQRVAEADPGLAVVVVDDGSSDATAAVAAAAGARVIRHPYNLGYGAAVQTGYKYALARGVEFVVQLDADGQHDPAQIPRLLDPVRRGECDLAIGSRFLGTGNYRMGAGRAIGRDLFRGLARLFGIRVTDPTSGFQALNRRVLEIYAGDFFPSDFPDVDVLVVAHRSGARICEVPVEMSEGTRASRLHGGLRPIYYTYKMLLSLWAASARRGGHPDRGGS
jgi:glycosyltransferase involved in cell wall biosynthesis